MDYKTLINPLSFFRRVQISHWEEGESSIFVSWSSGLLFPFTFLMPQHPPTHSLCFPRCSWWEESLSSCGAMLATQQQWCGHSRDGLAWLPLSADEERGPSLKGSASHRTAVGPRAWAGTHSRLPKSTVPLLLLFHPSKQ